MSINKSKVFYIVSIIILLSFISLSYYIFKPITQENSIALTSKCEFINIEENTIVRFDIYNHEDANENYTLLVLLNDKKLPDFTIIVKQHSKSIVAIPIKNTKKGNVTLLIYKEGKLDPIDQITFPLRFKNATA